MTARSRRILYLQYTNPAAYPSLDHSSSMLSRRGWEVLFLGTDAGALRFMPRPRITVRHLPFCPGGWRQKLHYARFAAWSVAWALWWRPRWLYASDALSCPIALLLALTGARVVYHEHDSPNLSTPSALMRLVLWARRQLCRRAELCVLPNRRRAARLAGELGANGHRLSSVVVWNCPSHEEVPDPKPRGGPGLRLYYHGSIVPSRLPPTVIEAVAMLVGAVELQVVGYETVGHLGYVDRLRELAERLGVGKWVEFVGPRPRNVLFDSCRNADVGLALVARRTNDLNEQMMEGASVKAFDYLACGLALLVPDLPEWRAMYVEPGYARSSDPDDPKSIADTLAWFLEHPDETWAMGERGRRRIAAEWNYEAQFAPVLARIDGG